ncbi:MAG: WYL domain-containing protein [Lachnospiraceae bacterium]|nr:WYL domain-containing protein [Lachnospiraceae bacterium]
MDRESSESKKLIPVLLQQLFLQKTDKTHFVRMPEIKNYLEQHGIFADRRTIYAAISILNSADFEIVGVQEKGGYKYHHPNRTFDTNELKFLIDSVSTSRFLTEKKSRELINKIKRLGSDFDSELLNRNFLMSNKIKSMNDKVLKNLDLLYSAMRNNYRVTFQYMKWTPQKKLDFVRKGETYLVSPFAVTLHDDNYYLIAFDNKYQDLRHFRIDKMQSIKGTDEPREGIEIFKNFNIVDYNQKTFNMFSGREESVQLQCRNALAGAFIDRFGTDITMRPDLQHPNHFITRITVNISPQFYGWLFGLGKGVKILAPESVITEFEEMAQGILSNYNRD